MAQPTTDIDLEDAPELNQSRRCIGAATGWDSQGTVGLAGTRRAVGVIDRMINEGNPSRPCPAQARNAQNRGLDAGFVPILEDTEVMEGGVVEIQAFTGEKA
ncbi:hypothetical protein ACHAXR_005005 [Thalassiosira sp. AJA248-18]